MKTLILNGSPKGNSASSNSKIFAEEFVRNMKSPCEIKCVSGSDTEELVSYIEGFDTIIFILPLYIHAMPGILMKFIEKLRPAASEGKSMGFIVQAGFTETAQEKYVEAYFAELARQLNYRYLGTVSKGGAAAIYMYPNMFKKVIKLINDLGAAFEETHAFDKEIVKQLGKPYELSKLQAGFLELIMKTGLGNIGWNKFLKQNNAFEKRLDRPFL